MRRVLIAAVAVAAGAAVTATMLSAPPVVLAAPVPVTGVEAGVVPLAVPLDVPLAVPLDVPLAVPLPVADAVPVSTEATGADSEDRATPVPAVPVVAASPAAATEVVSTPVDTVPVAAAATVAAAGAVAPTRLTLPALDINAPVVTSTTGADGVLHPPADIRTVGRWDGGARAGDPAGTTVLVGHLDSRTKGTGALYSLGRARPGDRITVSGVEYTTAAIRSYPKQALPEDLWATGGQPRLVIITCGGRFDTLTRSYEENVVVYALPT